MNEARHEAARRKRRIIYNNDGNDMIVGATPELYVADRMEQLPGTQVDTVFHCTGVTGLFTSHIPRVGEMLGEFVKDDSPRGDIDRRDNLRAMKEAGHDPFAIALDYCRQQGIEFYYSLRMNDIHDSMPDSAPFRPRWKRERPEVTLGRDGDFDKYDSTDPRAWWSSLNYDLPEVRDRVFALIEDVCTLYDIDGLELDFLRHPKFFRASLTLDPATPENLENMNDLMRRVRRLTDSVAEGRGRPMPIACRVPLSVKGATDLGLDVRTWLKDDLCDILVVSGGYVPMAMADELRAMVAFGHEHDVPVYACISESAMSGRFDSPEAWRGAAMNVWHAGADGVYTFNYFPTQRDELFDQMGDPQTLKGLDKLYAVDHIVLERFGGYQRPGLVAGGRLPVALEPESWSSVMLTVGEDVVAGAPAGKSATTRLSVQVSSVASGDKVAVRWNGDHLGAAEAAEPLAAEPSSAWFELDVDPALVRTGDNRVELRLDTTRNADGPITWDRLELALRYR